MNPLYQSYLSQQDSQSPPSNLQELLFSVAQRVIPQGMTPEQMVRQLMQNNQMSQTQFEQYAKVADKWTGRR